MTRYTQNADAANFATTTGMIGRMMDNFEGRGIKTASYSVGADRSANTLNPQNSTAYDIVSHTGVFKLSHYTKLSIEAQVQELTSQVGASPIAETWTSQLRRSIDRTNALDEALRNAPPLKQDFKAENMGERFNLGPSMEQVAKLIAMNKDTHERNAFHIKIGGFDTHNVNENTGVQLGYVDKALQSLEEELKLQGVWDQVVVVQGSEFARTVESNGGGSDHAWGGNYFMMGGAVKGGQILGQYPELHTSGSQWLPRGRLIPTTSWEMVWNGVAQWFDVPSWAMDDVLPLKNNFPRLFNEIDLFESLEI
jgi:uncharacterized protein (DUF1501 family)